MSDFETAVRKALAERAGEQAALTLADTDLHEVCSEAARAIRSLTNGKAWLELVPLPSGASPLAYSLDFVTEDEHRLLRVFAFSQSGYPVHMFPRLSIFNDWDKALTPRQGMGTGRYVSANIDQLPDRVTLRLAVNGLAEKESELLPLLEFVMRAERQTAGAGAE